MKHRVKKGDMFEVLEDLHTFGLSAWTYAYTGDFKCLLRKGTLLSVPKNTLEGRTAFYLLPVEYEKMEKELVPVKIRNAPRYNGYYFIFDQSDIGVTLKKVSGVHTHE